VNILYLVWNNFTEQSLKVPYILPGIVLISIDLVCFYLRSSAKICFVINYFFSIHQNEKPVQVLFKYVFLFYRSDLILTSGYIK